MNATEGFEVAPVQGDGRRGAAWLGVGFEAGPHECVLVVLPRRVPHARVNDRVVDRITKAGRRHGTFVGTGDRDAVDQHTGPAEERERAGLLGQIGVEGHPLAAIQLKQRIGRDLDERGVRNGVAEDDQRALLALHQPGPRVVFTLARHPGRVHEGVGRTAGVVGDASAVNRFRP